MKNSSRILTVIELIKSFKNDLESDDEKLDEENG